MRLRLVCMSFCLVLLLAGFLYVSVGAGLKPAPTIAAIKYRLGTGDEIDFTAVTKTNQGADSGLDADKLDGKTSGDFLQNSSSASNTFDLGDGQNTNKIYKFNIGGVNLPGLRYNTQTSKVQVSHDGTNWSDIGSAGIIVEKNDTTVASNISTLDFSSKFNATESPTGEANVDLASGGVTTTEIADGTIANADVATNAAIAESKLALNNPTHSNSNDPTAGEKAALAGTSGTPSGTNKYVTDADARNTNARTPTAHAATHASGGADALTGNLDATARTAVRKNTGGADVGSRRRLNLIEGTNITLTTTDDPTNEEVDVTIASTGAGSSAKTLVDLVKTWLYSLNDGSKARRAYPYGFADEFQDATGIDSGASSNYSARGTPNFDVTRVSGDVLDENYITGDDAQHDSSISTTDLFTGGTASASDTAGGAALNAVDDNTGTQWQHSGPAMPAWWKYDFGVGNAKVLTRYRFYGSASTTNGRPKNWTFQGSNNDTAWTDLDIRTNFADTNDTWTQWFDFTNTTAYRYYRFYIAVNTDVYPSGSNAGTFREIEGAGLILQVAQSFTPSASITLTKVELYLLQSGSPDGNVDVRIETDNANKPSGTLAYAGASASVTAASIGVSASYIIFDVTDGSLTGSTKYWQVLKRSSATTGTVSWRYDGTSPTYTGGDDATSSDGGTNWTVDTGHDALFKTYKLATNDGVVVSTAGTADAAPASILAVWGETPGTGSITMQVSRDGGTTWTAASTPTSLSMSDYTLKYKSVDVSAQPTGTSVKWKATIAGNAELEAVGVNWGGLIFFARPWRRRGKNTPPSPLKRGEKGVCSPWDRWIKEESSIC